MKLIQYVPVVHSSLSLLSVEVNKLILRGFVPHGTLTYASPFYLQAMVKYEQSTDSNTAGAGNPEPAGDTRPS